MTKSTEVEGFNYSIDTINGKVEIEYNGVKALSNLHSDEVFEGKSWADYEAGFEENDTKYDIEDAIIEYADWMDRQTPFEQDGEKWL